MHVYQITNLEDGKIYIGQYSDDDLRKYLRWKTGCALRGERGCLYLYNAIRKYGRDAFTIRSLASPIDKQQMDAMEVFFIRTFDARNPEVGYNILMGGEHSRLGIPMTVASRLKLSKSNTGKPHGHRGTLLTPRTKEHCANIGKANKGRVMSAEWIEKLTAPKRGKKHSAEWRAHQSASLKNGRAHRTPKLTEGQVRSIIALYMAGGVTMRALAQQFGVACSAICNIVTRKSWAHLKG